MGFRAATTERFDRVVAELHGRVDDWLAEFDRRELFSGPSRHFHERAIGLRRVLGSVAVAVESPVFQELLYATLTSWGMHRMGPGNAKLSAFERFCSSLAAAAPALTSFERRRVGELGPVEAREVAEALWRVIAGLDAGVGRAKLVVGTKTLHHLLPELLPPMDREYTLTCFFGHKGLQYGEADRFQWIFVAFNDIAARCGPRLDARVAAGGGMHTSRSKVLDNVVVGYVWAGRGS